jgi:hypothetical protein
MSGRGILNVVKVLNDAIKHMNSINARRDADLAAPLPELRGAPRPTND